MSCNSCGSYLVGKTFVRHRTSGPFRLCDSCGAPLGEIPRPRFGEPDESWVAQFGEAFKGKNDALAVTTVYATIQRDVPKILALMKYIESLRDDDGSEESSWIDYGDLFKALHEAIRWIMDFQLAISCLHAIGALLQGKEYSMTPIQYAEREELLGIIDKQIEEKGLEAVYEECIEAASDAAADIVKIVSETHRDLMSLHNSDQPASVLLALDSVVQRLTGKVDPLWSAQYAVMEMDRWSTAS